MATLSDNEAFLLRAIASGMTIDGRELRDIWDRDGRKDGFLSATVELLRRKCIVLLPDIQTDKACYATATGLKMLQEHDRQHRQGETDARS